MTNPIDPIELYLNMKPRMDKKIERSHVSVNLLPALDVDLAEMFESVIPRDVPRPENKSRVDIKDQAAKLWFQYRGQPMVLALHMLLISYLRRDTPFTAHAWALFERLWEEHTDALLEIMRTRDLISAMRTFADHSPNPVRRLSAKLAFTYGHMIKIYESERVAENRPLDEAGYQVPSPCPAIGIPSSHGVRLGGDNSFEIANMMMLEEVEGDEVTGPMILTLLARVYEGDTVFSRYDQARIAAGYNLNSKREWAFGFDPRHAFTVDDVEDDVKLA